MVLQHKIGLQSLIVEGFWTLGTKVITMEEGFYTFHHILSYNVPGSSEKESIEPIWSWSFVGVYTEECHLHFFIRDLPVQVSILENTLVDIPCSLNFTKI